MKNIYDIHTHILPKVDDGAASMREAMAIIEDEVNQGVTGIMLTPHYKIHTYEADESVIYEQYKNLKIEAKSRFPELDLRLGCEVRVTDDIISKLEKRKYATFNEGSTILLEFSSRHGEDYIIEKIKEFKEMSYSPVIAHIEYYPELFKKYKVVEELRALGAGIQIDSDSVLGYSDAKDRRFCTGLLKRRLVDYVASDVHNMTSRRSSIGSCADLIERKYGSDYANEILVENPGKFFEKK